MLTRQRKRRNTHRLIVPVISAAVLSYFGFHAFSGDYGLRSHQLLIEKQVTLVAELEGLRTKRNQLTHLNSLLENGSIEKDMLDERSRHLLNVAREDEIVIFR